MNPVAIVQARMSSSRLPGKVMRELAGRPLLWHVVDRLRRAVHLRNVVVATSVKSADQVILDFCRQEQIPCFAGSEEDVLDRYYRAALLFKADPVIRITADCPLIDPQIVDRLIELYLSSECEYAGVAAGAAALFMKEGRFPAGLDAECFSLRTLAVTWSEAHDAVDREHVTPYMWRPPERFKVRRLYCEKDYGHYRWTVDTEEDFQMVLEVYRSLYRPDRPFLMADVLRLLEERPEIAAINRHVNNRARYLETWKDTVPEDARGQQRKA